MHAGCSLVTDTHIIPLNPGKKCLLLTSEQPKQYLTTRNINYILSKSYLRLQGELKEAQAIKTTIHFLHTKIKHKLKSHSSYYFRLFDPSDFKQFEHGWTLSCHFTVSGKRSQCSFKLPEACTSVLKNCNSPILQVRSTRVKSTLGSVGYL